MAVSFVSFASERSVQETNFSREQVETASFVLPTSANDAKFIDKRKFSGAAIYVDGAGGGTITFYGCTRAAMLASTGGNTPTAVALKKADGSALTLTIDGTGIYEIDPAVFSVPYIAPVINSGSVNAVVVLTK